MQRSHISPPPWPIDTGGAAESEIDAWSLQDRETVVVSDPVVRYHCDNMSARQLARGSAWVVAVFASVALVRGAAADEKLTKTTIDSNSAGATVSVDGGVPTRAPTTVSLARGRHVVTISAEDRQPERHAIDAAGTAITLSVDLIRVPPESGTGKPADDTARKKLLDELTAKTGSAHLRDAKLAIRSDAVTLTLANVAFDPTETALTRDAAKAVGDVAGVLKSQAGVRFVVNGHTDDAPFKSDLARDKSELSLAHAVAVAHALIGAGVPADDVAADGRGDLDPIASNATPDGKHKNRRIEILILPKAAAGDGAGSAEAPKAKTLTPEAFKERMSTITDKARACYKGEQANVAVRLTIAPSGQVTKVVVAPPFTGKPEGDCVSGVVKSLTFDAWDGSAQSFSFAFLLSD
jgi:outer membrane protein OmpA-like peptidoglycan-associated protein